MYLSRIVLAVASSAAFFGSALAISGDATFYAPGVSKKSVDLTHAAADFFPSLQLGSCGQTNNENDLVVELSQTYYGQGSACGRRIRVNYRGKSVDVTAVGACQACVGGGIDLSPAAFNKIASPEAGRIRVDWNFT